MLYGKCIAKEPRSIIVIDTPGCSWRKCSFCAVHQQTVDEDTALLQVKTAFDLIPRDEKILQIVTSASYSDYPVSVQDLILRSVQNLRPDTVILEQRWGLRDLTLDVSAKFNEIGVSVEWIVGLEALAREDRRYLGKEDYDADIPVLRRYFKRVNLLFGYDGKGAKSLCTLTHEMNVLLPLFNVVSINIYESALDSILKRDNGLVEDFYNSPQFLEWKINPKVHIFDTDFRAESDFGGIDTLARA